MNQQRSVGVEGLVHVDVEANIEFQDLPAWLDTRLIVDAALNEYRRQRDEAVGPLPTRAHRVLFS